MVNSWGAGWGAQGYFWMSYEAISDGYLSEGAVGFLTDTVGYVPRLVARVHVSHPTRDRVGLGFAVGPRYGALWLKDFRQWRDVGVDQPFPENKMVFDLTDAEPFIASGQTDSVYFGAADYRRDNRTGTIQHVSIQHLDWGTIFESDSTPRAIPDDGAPAEVGMTIAELDHDVSATWVFRPSGKVEPGVGLVPTVEVRNFGAVTAAFTVALAIGGSYHDTAQVTGLAHAQAETVSFLPWTPQARETVVVRCTTALPGDEYPENDACVAWAFSRYTDAAVAGIVVPADTTDSGEVVRPQVRVCNNSTQTESFFVTFMIPSASYLRTARATVAADSEALVQFTPWTPVVPGSHALRCTLELSGDMDAGNNSLTGTVYVRPGAGLFEAGSALVPAAPAGSVSPDGRLVIRLGSQMAGSPLRAAVCDAAGRLHLRQEWNAGRRSSDVTLDLHSLAPGAYLCRIESGTTSTTVKFIKTR
jgi:hypothetical protein